MFHSSGPDITMADPSSSQVNGMADSSQSALHPIDQGVRDIAREFRFTVEEVQEFYDRCGEMGRTRTRFQKMREELSRFDDDKL